jgi:uncharacterized membrane protein YcaP (DUF421 family)
MELFLYKLFGEGRDLDTLQMCSRAFVIFFITLALIRISGRRTFGKRSAFDNTSAIILGAVLSRAVVGASPFVPTVACCLVLVLLHRGLAWISIKNKLVGQLIKGDEIPLYRNGKLNEENLRKSLLSENDLLSDVRLKGNVKTLNEVSEIYMETGGEVSIIKKK